ncbi:MAG TPA: DNA recombination protein RmuC [Burkholderiales bacterium]|nr:DNA recombination protein RmuC [Burkholderiales bacterium]
MIEMLLSAAVFLALGAAIGVAGHWLWRRAEEAKVADLAAERDRLATASEVLGKQVAALEERASRIPALEAELRSFQSLREDHAKVSSAMEVERRQAEEKLKLLLEAKDTLAQQFQNLANQILEEKGRKFAQQNVESLGALLMPLSERLKEFQGRVEETYDKESKQRFSLASEIQKLIQANAKISEDANNLANALKGNAKTRGTWGEVVLERVLESSGLTRGREYEVQLSLRSDGGKTYQPDVVIHLPEDRHVVVDSKVSLVAYEAYCSAEDEETRRAELKRHLASIQTHVENLAAKNYQGLSGIRSPDFVLMFVPVEPAFMLAAGEDHDLLMDAMARNVMVVSPTTLLISLRMIANIWRYEYQNRNAEELVRQCAAMYDKFVGFVADLEAVGKGLDSAQRTYGEALAKLTSGKGNLVRRAEQIRALGVKPSKVLPQTLINSSDEGDEASAELRLDAPRVTKPAA